MRVVLVGDSHLTETSPRRAVTKLPPRLRRVGLDVVSVAVGGANSRDVIDQPIPDDADWAIYSVGVNDAAPWKSVSLDEFEANYERILSTSSARHHLVLGPGPVIERHVSGERTNSGVAEYAAALARVAATQAASFVPLSDLVDVGDFADDGVHLNDSGYTKLAVCVLAELGVRTAQ